MEVSLCLDVQTVHLLILTTKTVGVMNPRNGCRLRIPVRRAIIMALTKNMIQKRHVLHVLRLTHIHVVDIATIISAQLTLVATV